MRLLVATGVPGVTMHVGDHICAFYRGDTDRDAILHPYLRSGIEAGDRCVCVLDRTSPNEVEARFEDTGSPGQLSLLRSEDSYLGGGGFSPDDMLDFWEEAARATFDEQGFDFLRAAGEMTWALRDLPGVEMLVAYEAELNRFLPKYPQTILCLYDLEQFTDGEILIDILRTHPKVLMSGMVIDNPWYVEPDEFFDPNVMIGASRPVYEGSADRDSLSRLRSLLVLAQLMMESTTEDQIVQLAAGAARSLAPCSSVRIDLDEIDLTAPAVASMLDTIGTAGGRVNTSTDSHVWTYPVHSGQGHVGWLVATCHRDPTEEEHFLLRSLAQHAGAAVANSRLHEQERRTAAEAERANQQLNETLQALRRSMEIHARLTEVAASGSGRQGIADAVHELTGMAVAVEDRFGNLRAWAGPDRPDPYPKESPSTRERLLQRALKAGRLIRIDCGWIGVTQPQPDVIGALVLMDPDESATEQQLAAVEHGLTVLAMELARLRSLAESELRIRRDLVEDLLAGTDTESALRRAQALRYDLERPHRVVVVEGEGLTDDDAFLHAVRRAARDQPVGSLIVRRGVQVVVLSDHDADWETFRKAVLVELRGGRCRVGVGRQCETIEGLPASLRQAESALRVQRASGRDDRATCYDDLGVYQLLAEVQDPGATETFARRWLADLLDYDEHRKADLVTTLSRYLDCGGNYDDTSGRLFIHRSTLKYRLQRIREITGFDLNDPDTRFNLQLACRAWETLSALRHA